VEGRRVALLTVDTYRVAAPDQLRRYADLIGGVSFQIARTREALAEAIGDVRGHDLILIDTPGRNPRDADALAALGDHLDCGAAVERQLLVEAATGPRELRTMLENYRRLGVSKLLYTKLDEAESFGSIYNGAVASGLPLEWFTTGQRVPEDLEDATHCRLAGLLWGGERN
jgi:flagellar biosynthesis protein FlhF